VCCAVVSRRARWTQGPPPGRAARGGGAALELAARRAGLGDAARRRVQRPRAAGHPAARGALAAGQTAAGARPDLPPPSSAAGGAVCCALARRWCAPRRRHGLRAAAPLSVALLQRSLGSRRSARGARARTRQKAAGRCGGAGASPSRRRARAGRGRAASAHRMCARPLFLPNNFYPPAAYLLRTWCSECACFNACRDVDCHRMAGLAQQTYERGAQSDGRWELKRLCLLNCSLSGPAQALDRRHADARRRGRLWPGGALARARAPEEGPAAGPEVRAVGARPAL